MHSKTVLITGAGKRIGAGIARYLHENGMNIIINYNNSAKKAHELARKLNDIRNDSAITLQGDISQKKYHQTLIDSALTFKGSIDVLINNASAFYPTPITEICEEQWEALINTNLKAPLFLSKLAAPSIGENKGCIINMVDIHAHLPLKNHTIYSISKSGLVMLTKSLAKELAPNIRVNAIAPGAICWQENIKGSYKQDIIDKTMLKREGKIEDISKTVLYLIRDANYVTGQVINIDGGKTLYS